MTNTTHTPMNTQPTPEDNDPALKKAVEQMSKLLAEKEAGRIALVSVESGTDARTFSEHYAKPVRVFVDDECVYPNDLERQRDAAVARAEAAEQERDWLRRDLIKISKGCEVGCPDIEEAIRRIIGIKTERDSLRAQLAQMREALEKEMARLDYLIKNAWYLGTKSNELLASKVRGKNAALLIIGCETEWPEGVRATIDAALTTEGAQG